MTATQFDVSIWTVIDFWFEKKTQPLSAAMDTDKKVISLNHQKKFEELTNFVENTSTEEVNKQVEGCDEHKPTSRYYQREFHHFRSSFNSFSFIY